MDQTNHDHGWLVIMIIVTVIRIVGQVVLVRLKYLVGCIFTVKKLIDSIAPVRKLTYLHTFLRV